MRKNLRTSLASIGLALAVGLMLGAWAGPAGATSCGSGHDQAHDKEHGEAIHQQAGHDHAQATLHGGQVTAVEGYHFETVFSADGVRIFIYNADQAPMMVKKAKGTATLAFENGPKVDIELVRTEPSEDDPAVHFCPMHAEVVQFKTGLCTHCSGMKLFVQDYLFAKADLSNVKPGKMKAALSIEGLKGIEAPLSFTEVFAEPKAEKATSKEG